MSALPQIPPGWSQTFTGKAFYPLDPNPDDICLTDIAHALARLCRYNGHSGYFYSVAEHCLWMACRVPGALKIHALLHDAPEAYVPDIPPHLKDAFPGWREMEFEILEAIYTRLDIPLPTDVEKIALKRADLRMLRTEREHLMCAPPAAWSLVEDVEPYDFSPDCLPPENAERAYLNMLTELGF